MSKYTELLRKYELLKSDYHCADLDKQRYKDQAFNLDRKVEDLKDQLNAEKLKNAQLESKLATEIATNKVNADVIQFLVTGKANDKSIEFVGVKTYREGWVALYLNGEDLNAGKYKSVTVWSEPNETVQVEVTTR